MKSIYEFDSPIGKLRIAENSAGITHLLFPGQPSPEGYALCQTPLLQKAQAQLAEYFAGSRKTFDLPLAPEGGAFRQDVWAALLTIPYGQTRSYMQIAAQVGKPKASRAVGGANHNNPISIFIPCHRVIGASGKLTGYGGGLDIKENLLRLEGFMR